MEILDVNGMVCGHCIKCLGLYSIHAMSTCYMWIFGCGWWWVQTEWSGGNSSTMQIKQIEGTLDEW